MNLEINALLPFLTQALLISGLFIIRSTTLLYFLIATQILYAFVRGIVDPVGLFAISVFWGLCVIHWRHRATNEAINTLLVLLLAFVAIAFANHMVPGFHNLRVFSETLVSPTSMPFTMYLNFDKTIAPIVLAVSSGFIFHKANVLSMKVWKESVLVSVLCISLLIPLAMLSGYVHFDPKLPNSFFMWAFNNLLFVCFAEEVIFRGIIQNQLTRLLNQWNLSSMVSIFISALLFAVTLSGHRQGGILFMAFVALSGLFYGYVYQRTKRLEAAIFVHFSVNLIHFLFFSYPLAAGFVK